ncbi:nuclear condensin complex subunit Smc2 [Gigaspora rosea]|uniref:Nuclear condensin complex subunit Smc2 n=1 Tax=Gigaspora rosea TaxID=44941 RepID=A0A397UEU5_9GLOM|nr:nuclear condensin complex subunit Smc2 [Gigaspora rosea]
MRIEELIIDGFKSYAVRTIISGWDPEFNAITGLNGSGKSNILDAICFVLGITNLNQVRASNMQDLIYKRGQTGVNKASVTIVFNNEDRDNSPVGFEQYSRISITRQIILGGQSKYIVNGHRAQQNVVQNLFQSVQLNINNPHFLIMQGRITKVLNMKPPEILAMIEEAAGTRMFEERKEKALKTIAKKEKKLEEITELLKEEIGPKLDKLRTEKRSYLEFQKTESDIERLTRLVVAYEYTKHLEKLDRSGADHEAKKVKVQELLELNERLKDEITYLEEDIRQTTLNKEKEIGAGDKIQIKNKDSLLSVKAEIEQNLSQKRKNYETLQAQFDQIKKNHDEKSEKVRKSDELLQTLSTGVSAQEGHENGYMEQLQEKELREKEPQAQKAQKDGRGLLSTLESARKTAQDLHANLSKIDWDQSRMEDLLKKKLIEEKAIQDLTEKCESLSSQLSNLEFVYSKPTPDFDRNTVKGLVAELISLDPRFANCSTALEICAGGRLYNVVVNNEKIGSLLLEKGKLRKKITIIPLNKIQAFKLPAERIAAAQRLSPGKVNLALTLIGYDREVTPAMEYVFGGTLICADADSAKLVTFHKSVHAKSVTLEGDVYDPSGTLQGGSKPSSEGILNKMQTFRELKDKLKYHQQALDQLKFEIEDAQKIMHKYNQVKQQLDLKTHEIALLEEQVNKSSNSQIIHVVENIMSQIAEQENIIVASKEKYKACQITCQRLENEMKEFKNNRDSKLKEIQRSVAQGKAELSQSNQVVITMNRDVQILHLEIKQLEEDLQNSNKDIENSDKSIKQLMDIVASMETELSNLKSSLDNAQSELDNERNILSAFDEEIKELQAAIKTKTAQMTEVQLEISRINHELERFLKEKQTAQQAILQMEQNYDWIIQQKHHFGKPNTAYDFINNNPNECKKMLRQLEEKHNNMRKKINAKVMNMIDSVEKKEASLNQMLATVLKDKKKIEDTIVSLDDYKKDALQKTWEKVNADFGAIFADLLPNSFAKLEPLEGRDLTHGLEVKVQLGGVWKQSLSELSGGQR